MLKFDKASGLYYDRDTASVYVDENGTTFMGSFNPDCSDAYLKLFLLFCIENDSAKLEKIRKKRQIQKKMTTQHRVNTVARIIYEIEKKAVACPCCLHGMAWADLCSV